MTEMTAGLNLVLLGRTGAGKSSSGNTILGRQAFIAKKSSSSVTRDIAVESGAVCELPVQVYDTPGFFDTGVNEQKIQLNDQNLFQRCESGPCVFLLVIKADRFTEEERKTVEKIEEILGENRLEKTWILFTRGDELEDENMTIKEFIDDNEPLKNLVQKYDQRYHVFNNKKKGPSDQVEMLLKKIVTTYIDIQAGEEGILKLNPLMRKTPIDIGPDAPADSPSSRRIVLLGKSGVGKSASGNTILGQREFDSVMRMNSVTSKCSDVHATVSGRSVSVVDTPGLFDTEMNPEELAEKIARSVYISSPGPHAFLIVFPVNMRFTEHEQQIPQIIRMLFGQEVLKYSIILFTHGDLLEGKSVEELIKENCRLRDLVQQCGGRYHVFNNKDLNNREQVNDLLQKIDTMIEQNGGGHYSNQMFEDALRFRREEEEQRQREEEERKQQEEKQIQEKIERVRKETEERIRAEMRAEYERLKTERLNEEEQRKQAEEQRKEFERKIKEAEERMRAEMRAEYERLKTERLNEEEQRKQAEEQRKEFERKIKEAEERIRAEMRAEYERLKTERLNEEEQRKQAEEQRKEFERKMKEAEERIRAEMESKFERQTSQNGFLNFISKYKRHLTIAAFVLGGILVGAVVLAGVGAIVGAGVAAYTVGGGALTANVCGAVLSASAVGVAAGGAGAAGAGIGAVATGACIGAGVGAGVGVVAGAAGGAFVGAAASEDAS